MAHDAPRSRPRGPRPRPWRPRPRASATRWPSSPRAGRHGPRLRHRGRPQHRLRRGRGRGGALDRLAGAAGRRRPQPLRRAGAAAGLGRDGRWPSARRPGGAPMACARPPSWPRWPTPCCCWWPWAPSSPKPCAGFARARRVDTDIVMLVAGLGVVINTATALLFMRGSQYDLNVRGAFLHMAATPACPWPWWSARPRIALTGLLWIDPALSLLHRRRDRARHLEPAARFRRPGAGRRARAASTWTRCAPGSAAPARRRRRSTTCTSGP